MAAADQHNTRKGELLPYNSLFPPAEAQKAAQLVEAEIAEHQKQLDRLRLFSSDNTDLINLVRKLPDEPSHSIMVPFGKAAFFPGRLIHTNEFVVLLGEGYYAEQTAKQTVGVLKRRGNVLEPKIEGLTAMISDLRARAEFFGTTAGESGEGIVEIREFEEPQYDNKGDAGVTGSISLDSLEKNVRKEVLTNEEYERILAGLDELEKAEHAAENMPSEDENGSDGTKTIGIDEPYNNGKVQKPTSLLPPCKHPIKDFTRRGETSGTHLQPSAPMPSPEAAGDDLTRSYGHRKAFTGAIVEHSDGLDSSLSSSGSSQATASKPSRPVSRFKMQKGR